MVIINLLSNSGFSVPTAALEVPQIMIVMAAEMTGTRIDSATPIRAIRSGSNVFNFLLIAVF